MAKIRRAFKLEDSVDARARARLLAHFEDHQEDVFYSRQLEILFEREYFHWVTNRAIRSLVEEGRIRSEARPLSGGSEIKLLWHKSFRFYKRAADAVFRMVDEYTSAANDGALGMQGEHLVLAAFARQKFVLLAEESSTYRDITWDQTGHDLDFIFERDGMGYGIEVKNTLGYMDHNEFIAKIMLARHIGVVPIFAVRQLPQIWISKLVKAGGFAMIMGYQFYPWTHKSLATRIHEQLGLPVDTPRRIEQGTMQRLENWIEAGDRAIKPSESIDEMLRKEQEEIQARRVRASEREED